MADEAHHKEDWRLPRARNAWRDNFLALVPLVSIMLLVFLIGTLLWVVNQSESTQRQSTLNSDSQWVEQALRYQLAQDEDLVARVAFDTASGELAVPDLAERVRLHLASNPEMQSLIWFDASSNPVLSIPPQAAEQNAEILKAFVQMDYPASARPVYAIPRRNMDETLLVDLGVRAADGSGFVVATISLTTLIQRQIPWWIAEKYAVQMLDAENGTLAERSHPDQVDTSQSMQIVFDPPIPGASLKVIPYAASVPLTDKLLPAGIIGVAAIALLSLAILQSQSARRLKAEERLSAEIAFRHSMEDSLTVGIRAKDHEGRYLYVNKALCEMVGYEASELVGRQPPMPYWQDDIREDAMDRHYRLKTAKPETFSWDSRFRRRDGKILDVHLFEAPLLDDKGVHQGWICSIIDITEQKKSETAAHDHIQSLQRTGRLISLGEMASTLAHELNQPLSAVASYATGSLNMIKSGRADATTLAPVLEKLSVQVDRAGRIIHRIQNFIRKRDPVLASVQLAEIIETTATFMTADAREYGVKIKLDLAQELPPIMADHTLIEQVLINLIRNGIEAMTEAETTSNGIGVTLSKGAGSQVIEVIDRGGGISDELAPRLFEAFTTTRPEGMGIGLNVCRSIVELHRGRLSHRPNPGGGTIFQVSLPESENVQDITKSAKGSVKYG